MATNVDTSRLPDVLPSSVARVQQNGRPTQATIDNEFATRAWYLANVQDLTTKQTDIVSQFNNNKAEVSESIQTLTNDQEALAQKIDEVKASTDTSVADIQDTLTSYAGVQEAQADHLTTLDAKVGTNDAKISSESQARADAVSAITDRLDTMTASIGANEASITTEQQARIDADTAISGRQDTFETTLNGNTATLSELTESVDGIKVQKVLTATLNGDTGGYEFAGVTNADGTGGTFGMSFTLDTFQLTDPNWNSGTTGNVFSYANGLFTFNVPVKFGAGQLLVGAASLGDKQVATAQQNLFAGTTNGTRTDWAVLPYSVFTFTIDAPASLRYICNPAFYMEGGSPQVLYTWFSIFINGQFRQQMGFYQSNTTGYLGGPQASEGISQFGSIIFETRLDTPGTYTVDMRWSVRTTAPAAKLNELVATEFLYNVQYR